MCIPLKCVSRKICSSGGNGHVNAFRFPLDYPQVIIMANILASIKAQVETQMREDHFEQVATRIPRKPVTLKTNFPVELVWSGPLKTRTQEMKTKRHFYRWTVDAYTNLVADTEAVITLEVWRHLAKLERHLMTLGELHLLRVLWDGEPIEVSVVALFGGEEARDEHPSILEVGAGLRGFTVGTYPLNLLKVLNKEEVEGVCLTKRFLFHLLGIQEILGTMTVEEFAGYYTATDIRNLISYVGIGQSVTRPTVAEAKLDDIVIVGPKRKEGIKTTEKVELEEDRSRKRKSDGSLKSRSLSEDSPRSSKSGEEERRGTRRALLFEEGSKESKEMWEKIGTNNNKEGEAKSPRTLRAKAALMGQFSWGSFLPHEFPAAARYAKRMGITTNPPPPPPPGPSSSGSRNAKPTTSTPALDDTIDDGEDSSTDTLDLPTPVPAVEDDELPPLVTLDDSGDCTMQSMASGTSCGSPRAELSGRETGEDDLLLQDSSEEKIEWSPFLSKAGAPVVDVSSSESSTNSSLDGSGMKREPSVIIIEQNSVVDASQEKAEDADESVKIIGEKEKPGRDKDTAEKDDKEDEF